MSYCGIVQFINGVANEEIKFGNSWGGHARIWNAVYDKYLKNPLDKYDNWLTAVATNGKRVWDLHKRKDIPKVERTVFMATFDRAVVFRKDFAQFAEDLQTFADTYPTTGVCHLKSWAKTIQELPKEVEAIAFHGTSVSENLWSRYNEEIDEMVQYNLNTQADHFDVYAEMNNESSD